MEIGAQLYTLHEYMTSSDKIIDGLKKVKEIGYKYVQLSGIARMDVDLLKNTLDELDLKAVCTHIPYDAMKDHVKEVAQAHRALGCKYVGLGAMPDEFRNKEGFIGFAKQFDELNEKYEAEGLKLTYHNHNFEFADYGGKTGMQLMLENSRKFLFLADTFWIQSGGGDVIQWFEKLAGRLEIVHFKDYGLEPVENAWEPKRVMREIGYGNLNWNGIIDVCKDLGVTHAFVEQDDCNGRDPFESLKMSYDFLKKAVR